MIRLEESDHGLISLFEHDLRANASRLSRGKTGFHFSRSCSELQIRYFAIAASLQPQTRSAGGQRAVDDLDRVGEDRLAEIHELQPMRGRRDREHMGARLRK